MDKGNSNGAAGPSWRHNTNQPPIMFFKSRDGYEAGEICDTLSQKEAAAYVTAGVAGYLADNQVYQWQRDFLYTNLKTIVDTAHEQLRQWIGANDTIAIAEYYSTSRSKENCLKIIKDSPLTNDEKKYILAIVEKMAESDFGQSNQ